MPRINSRSPESLTTARRGEVVSVKSNEVRQNFALRLVWGAGGPRDSESETGPGFCSLLPTQHEIAVRNIEVFSPERSMVS